MGTGPRRESDDLIEDLGHSNLTVRMMATNQLVDRIRSSAIAPVQDLLGAEQSSPFQRIHGLWVLHRLGALDLDILKQAAGDPAAEVRLHAVRILSEVDPFEDSHRELALAGCKTQTQTCSVKRRRRSALLRIKRAWPRCSTSGAGPWRRIPISSM